MENTAVHPASIIIQPNTIYEFTINTDDIHQFYSQKDTRLRLVKESIEDVFQTFPKDVKYHLFAELSDLQYGNCKTNRYSRYHYHGILLFGSWSSIRNFYGNKWYLLTSKASIQLNPYRPLPTDKHPGWPAYCRKQKPLFKNHERIKNASWEAIEKLQCTPA